MPSIPVSTLKLAVARARAKSTLPDMVALVVVNELGLEFRLVASRGFSDRHLVTWLELENWHEAAVQVLIDAKLDATIANLRKAIDGSA